MQVAGSGLGEILRRQRTQRKPRQTEAEAIKPTNDVQEAPPMSPTATIGANIAEAIQASTSNPQEAEQQEEQITRTRPINTHEAAQIASDAALAREVEQNMAMEVVDNQTPSEPPGEDMETNSDDMQGDEEEPLSEADDPALSEIFAHLCTDFRVDLTPPAMNQLISFS